MIEDRLFDSSNFLRIQDILTDLYVRPSFEMIQAITRAGKTIALKYFASKNDGVLYIEVKPAESASTFWSRLLYHLIEGKQSLDFLQRANINYLIENSSQEILQNSKYKLIIIDEVGNFKPGFVRFIRQLTDNVSHKCSVVLTAPKEALEKMELWKVKKQSGMAEFLSRIDYVHKLPKHSDDDIKQLLKVYEIKKNKLLKFITKEAESLGDAVRMVKNDLRGRLDY